MNKVTIICLVMMFWVFTQCNQSNDKLLEKFDAVIAANEQAIKTNKDYSVISLDSLTDFKWDSVYFFSGNTGGLEAAYVSEQIGFEWQGSEIEDNYYRLLFTKGKQVVSYVDLRKDTYPIYFYGCRKQEVRSFSRDEAVFASFARCNNNGKRYLFISMSCIDEYSDFVADKC